MNEDVFLVFDVSVTKVVSLLFGIITIALKSFETITKNTLSQLMSPQRRAEANR